MARYLVEYEVTRRDEVLRALKALAVPVVGEVMNYFIVDIPPAMEYRVRELPGVIDVIPERVYYVAFVPVEVKLRKLAPMLMNPVTAPQALALSAEMDVGKYYWVTGESRKALGADKAQAAGVTGRGVKVAVIDTGVDPTLMDLLGTPAESCMRAEPVPWDENGHGSHVSSTCCGRGAADPHGKILGVAPGATLKAFKALGFGVGTGLTSEIMKAILRAGEWGAKVINMSLGADIKPGERWDVSKDPLCRAIKYVSSKYGAIVCVAAGNSGRGYASTPGICPEAVTVSAVDHEFRVADFVSRGHPQYVEERKPEVAAPGVNIHATCATASLIDNMQWMDGPRRACISGTSMATPHVTGLMALWVQYLRGKGVPDEEITASMVKDIVRRYGGGWSEDVGYGVPRFEWVVSYWEEVLK